VPGDPNECRMHARECLRLAESASKQEARETFSNLARTWLSLAAELERNQALLDTWGIPAHGDPLPGPASELEHQPAETRLGPPDHASAAALQSAGSSPCGERAFRRDLAKQVAWRNG
jgi:hypothetical protein